MDKFSIYELLSIIIPGFVATKIIQYYLNLFNVTIPFPIGDTVGDNIFLLVVVILLGVVIHVLTFRLMKYKWFKYCVYPSESEYIVKSKCKELSMIMPSVTQYYLKDKMHDDVSEKIIIKKGVEIKNNVDGKEQTVMTEDVTQEFYNWTFDFAYYYLEVSDKIAQAKNFQSFYFMFRNLFVLSLVNFIILSVLAFSSYFGADENNLLNCRTVAMFVLLIIFTWLLSIVALWLRGKMIDRVFWSYYVDRRIKDIDNHNKMNKNGK